MDDELVRAWKHMREGFVRLKRESRIPTRGEGVHPANPLGIYTKRDWNGKNIEILIVRADSKRYKVVDREMFEASGEETEQLRQTVRYLIAEHEAFEAKEKLKDGERQVVKLTELLAVAREALEFYVEKAGMTKQQLIDILTDGGERARKALAKMDAPGPTVTLSQEDAAIPLVVIEQMVCEKCSDRSPECNDGTKDCQALQALDILKKAQSLPSRGEAGHTGARLCL